MWTVDPQSMRLRMIANGEDRDGDDRVEYKVQNVLIVCKIRNKESARAVSHVAQFLIEEYNARVVLEEHVLEDLSTAEFATPEFAASTGIRHPNVFYFTEGGPDVAQMRSKMDLVITIGGDGTMLYFHSLFSDAQQPIPPVLSFVVGHSLGFLLPHDLAEYRESIRRVMEGSALATKRMRLECEIWRRGTMVMSKFSVCVCAMRAIHCIPSHHTHQSVT